MLADGKYELSSQAASQILWSTGTLASAIPNGFYSIIPDKKLKELFDTVPSLDDLYSLGADGLKAEIILVDIEKDRKLSMLKQLCAALVKGLSTNPTLLIKKIAGLVFDFYKRPNSESSPAKSSGDEMSHMMDNKGIQLLGQIKHGSCRPRAILFKFLADSVGLESKLVVGLSSDGSIGYADSYKHISVVVVLDSVELLVDLMRFPGQLFPFSTKAIFMSHISTAGESDSAENDSCDSPLEPNSPLCGFADKLDDGCPEKDENQQSLYQRRLEASSNVNVSVPALRNIIQRSSTFSEGKLSISHSEPNISNAFWRDSRRKAVAEQRTTSSSPEHPLLRGRGRSMLSGDRQLFREYANGVAISRSDGGSTSDVRRLRRRSISITPEIGDDIARAVRAMNEELKRDRLSRGEGPEQFSPNDKKTDDPLTHGDMTSNCDTFSSSRNQTNPNQKAISLPSSPNEFRSQAAEKSGMSDFQRKEDSVSTWNKVLQSSVFLNQPLSPLEEWNIDFSELTVGTRVGIGFFGEVFRGIWNGTDVAIKVFLEQDLTTENMEDFCNEISILSRLRHPNGILLP